MKRSLLPLALFLFVSCTVTPSTISDRLFCGMSIRDGGVVTDAEVETFLTEVVEPRFPDGFTVWRARGAWQGGREDTLVIEIVHRNDPDKDRRMREIASIYRERFRQESVLRVTTAATMQFVRR